MASQGAEYEAQIRAWIKAYEDLPEERRERLKSWFATQRLIVENAGISLREWCAHLEWAMNHPLDYTFILDFPAKPEPKTRDESQRGDETRQARTLIGAGEGAKQPLDAGAGIQEKAKSPRDVDHELLARFMKERMKPGSK